MSEVEKYIKEIEILNDKLASTKNDLFEANQRCDQWRRKYENECLKTKQLTEDSNPTLRPSFEEMVAFAQELKLLQEIEGNSPASTTDSTNESPNETERFETQATEREKELENLLEEKERELSEKDRQLDEIASQKDSVIDELNKKVDELNKKVKDLQTKNTIRVKENFTSNSEVAKKLSGREPEDRRIDEDSFNGEYVEELTEEEKDNLEASKIEQALDKGTNRSKASQEALKKELEKEGRNIKSVKAIFNLKKRLRLSEIDYSKGTRSVKAQLKKALGLSIDNKYIEIRLLTEEEISSMNGRVVKRKGKPDYCYYVVMERLNPIYRYIIVQGVRMAFKRKPKRKRKNNNLEDCALPENRTPLEEKPTTEGQTLQEAAPCSEEQPCAQAAPCSEEQPCAQAAPCSEAQPCAEAEPDIDEEEEKKTRFNTIWAPCDVKRALNCGMFSPQTFAWIIDEKYNHGSTFEDIIGRLADQGLKIDKVTFNENVHRVLDRLRLGCQPLFRDRIRLGTHEAVDETFMLVAVKTKVEKDGKMVEVTEYKIRYMWCFYDYINQNVYYVYEDGSRAQDVLKNTFFSPDCDKATLMLKTLISDGYSAYNLFDNPKEGNPFMDANGNPLVLHCGDWVHARRRIVHMIVESQEEALTLINMVRELFVIEAFAKNAKLTPERIKEIRAKYAIPVINDIFQKVEEYSKDAALMGRQYTANAISYILKQRTRLTNYTKDGKALISSNCVERLMKPVKKILKTCMFIGSENAARNFAFTLSLMMTAKKHNIKFYDYMVDLLNGLQNAPELKKGEEEEYEKAISTMADPYMPWHYVKVR